MVIDYKRQTLIFNPNETQASVTIIGLGNIGSHTAITLARLGVKSLVLYDFDAVEVHNLSSQAYCVDDIGKNKAEALACRLKKLNPSINILAVTAKAGKDVEVLPSDICIIAVDSMEERKNLHKIINSSDNKPSLIIDARLGGAQLEVYSCLSMEEWQGTFANNPSQEPCGGRFICYVSCIVGGLITNQVKKYLKREEYKKTIIINVDTLDIMTSNELS